MDGHNILFTLINYRRGIALFIGSDGMLRDAGGAHGKLPAGESFSEEVELLTNYITGLRLKEVRIFLDAPIPGSGILAAQIRSRLRERRAAAFITVKTAPSADPLIRDSSEGCIASSDSAVILSAQLPVFDLARAILEKRYKVILPRIGDLLEGKKQGYPCRGA